MTDDETRPFGKMEVTLEFTMTEENAAAMELMIGMAIAPRRIQLSRKKGWRKPPVTVNVARPGRWGNPFRIGQCYIVFDKLGWGMPTDRKPGDLPGVSTARVVRIEDRAQAVAMHAAWMRSCLASANPPDLSQLRDQHLACWCPLDQPCHADNLLELANPKEETDGTEEA